VQTRDNPAQQRRIEEAVPVIDQKLTELARSIELRRSAGFEAALKLVSSGDGKRYMDQLRSILDQMEAEELALLDRRAAEVTAAQQTASVTIIGGTLLALGFVSTVGWLLTHTLSRQIGTAVGQVQTSSAELQAAATQQATGSKEQATAMMQIGTTISELVASSRQISASASRVSEIAGQTAAAARAGDETVITASEAIHRIRQQVDVIVSHMLELGAKSQRSRAVLDIVSELAEQTTILSINAAIEAAGAGETGKRFTVVADEIRKLADRVTVSTKEIRGLIGDIRDAVHTTVMATETGSKSVDAGAAQFEQVRASLKRISDLVVTTTGAAREIHLSTTQQMSAVEQVNVAIRDVSQTTRETEASSSQTQQTASQLARLSRDLLRLVQPQMTTMNTPSTMAAGT
jgi:methyl-accepting chemotaxis protein